MIQILKRAWYNWSQFIKIERYNSKWKTASKGININTDLIEYVPKTLVKKGVRKNPNMLIILSTVFRFYLCQSQTHYQIHTTIQDHKFIVLKIMYQHILVQTKI